MQVLEVAQLSPGQSFPLPLFHASGRKLIPANTVLTPRHIEALLGNGIKQVCIAENAKPVVDAARIPHKVIAAKELRVGSTAEMDLLTPDGTVLVQANEQIEDHHVAALHDSHVEWVMTRPQKDLDTIRHALQCLTRTVLDRLEQSMVSGQCLRAPECGDAFRKNIPQQQNQAILNLNGVYLLRRRLSMRLQPLYGQLETGRATDISALESITNDLIDLMNAEPRQFTQLALMTPRKEDHLPDHAVSMAVLAMAIAVHLNLSEDHVRQTIRAALLADVGMLMVPRRIRLSRGRLLDDDLQRVHQHPVFSLTMMEHIPEVTDIEQVAAYQHHERLNGTGYPVRARGESISDFARIIAVSDIFAAAANPRAYKTSKLPYIAMEEIVRMAHKGLLDVRVVKALLSAVGLFPVGSYVVLSNGIIARVVGTSPNRIDRPLVCPMIQSPGAPRLLDLNSETFNHIKIVKPIAAPEMIQ